MFRTRNPQHRQLASVDLFTTCSARELDTVDRLGTEVAVRAGTRVWHEGRTEPQFVIVLDGRIEVTRADERIATLGAGTWFGHDALIRRLRNEPASGVTTTPTRLLVFSKREFASLLRAVPSVAETLRRPIPSTVPLRPRDEARWCRDDAARSGARSFAREARRAEGRAPAPVLVPGGIG
jgi:CRP/FNR family transcriptional regulator, cyclic AMP receptor protein